MTGRLSAKWPTGKQKPSADVTRYLRAARPRPLPPFASPCFCLAPMRRWGLSPGPAGLSAPVRAGEEPGEARRARPGAGL